VDRDFRWACGAHPFGPFGTWQSSAVSWLLLDQALRNPLLLRLDAALRSIELAVSELAHFAGSYIGPEVEAQVRGWPVQLLGDLQTQRDAFAWSPTTSDPLTRALVAEGSSLRGALGSSTFSEDRRHRLQSGDLPDAAAAAAAESRLSVLASRSPVGGHWLLPAWAHWLYLSAVRAGQEHESNAVDTAIAASRDAESEALRGGGPRLATRSLSRDTPAVVVARARVQLHELAAHLRALSAALGVGELERADAPTLFQRASQLNASAHAFELHTRAQLHQATQDLACCVVVARAHSGRGAAFYSWAFAAPPILALLAFMCYRVFARSFASSIGLTRAVSGVVATTAAAETHTSPLDQTNSRRRRFGAVIQTKSRIE